MDNFVLNLYFCVFGILNQKLYHWPRNKFGSVAHTRDRYNRISKYNFQSYDMSRVCGSEVYKAYMRVKEYNSSLEKDVLTIHTAFVDGSLRFKKFGNMGRCFGGLGVYWGNNDPRNLSEPCGAEIVSSDGAELMAILRALQVCGDPTSSLRIESDSMHSILAIRGRFTIIDPVIRDILKRIKFQLNLRQAKVYFAKVPAHNGIPGNEAADKLAKIGSTTCMRRFEREYYKNSYKNPYDIPYKSPYKSPYKNFYPLR
ncbi:ribonuclease H-like domain-containing protein [Phycomyces blakesleeanus]